MIRYLNQDEKIKSRTLWENVFSEDSEGFLDYYFSDRFLRNKIVAGYKEGKIVAMIHQNPYKVVVRDQIWNVDYLAGVATDPDYRQQGFMRRLLSRCFLDMYEREMAFSFLVPVDPAIYHPFDFTYINDLPVMTLNERGNSQLKRHSIVESSGEYRKVSDFITDQLKDKYEVYTLRNEDYYRDLCLEVRSDRGDLVLLMKEEDNQSSGVFAYYGETAENVRELICLPEYTVNKGSKKPYAMGRIIHMEKFLSAISLKEESPVDHKELFIEIKDAFISQNNGIFQWRLDKKSSYMIPVRDEENIKPQMILSIREMTAWLFGYGLPAVSDSEMDFVEMIRPLKGVFFDEVT